uniref:Bm14112 n=1 Tax=Brugia malayi TaxID=6279 RepID=A0A0J9Y9C9_BRUMA|nr:Bm14112 [Brugia malayi]
MHGISRNGHISSGNREKSQNMVQQIVDTDCILHQFSHQLIICYVNIPIDTTKIRFNYLKLDLLYNSGDYFGY